MTISMNSAKSFIGHNVNIRLRDGVVVVNVKILRIDKKRDVIHNKGKEPLSFIENMEDVQTWDNTS